MQCENETCGVGVRCCSLRDVQQGYGFVGCAVKVRYLVVCRVCSEVWVEEQVLERWVKSQQLFLRLLIMDVCKDVIGSWKI